MAKRDLFHAWDNADTGLISTKILSDDIQLQQQDFVIKHVAEMSKKGMWLFMVANASVLLLALFRLLYLNWSGYTVIHVPTLWQHVGDLENIVPIGIASLGLALFIGLPACCRERNQAARYIGRTFVRRFMLYTYGVTLTWLLVLFLFHHQVFAAQTRFSTLEPALLVLIPLSYIGAMLVIPYFSMLMLLCLIFMQIARYPSGQLLMLAVMFGFFMGFIGVVFYFVRRGIHFIAEVEFKNYKLTEKLIHSLNQDGLLAIPNRQAFFTSVGNKLQRKNTQPQMGAAILMVDVDHFKQYNDHYGHPAGDRCLQQVALCLQQSIRADIDMVGRYGGEEFILYLDLEAPDSQAVEVVAARLQQRMAELALPHVRSATARHVTLSVGIAMWQPGATLTALCEQADRALYQAKQSGRNRCVLA